ncbi:CatA-like O-acetyltransferase [Gottfriedia acidiceleris]|uniref:CatA-like O-acetyltransferase n=2 Tax=Gottfriedia acidiceleris TaxID=371036 RepID=UPI002FFF5422
MSEYRVVELEKWERKEYFNYYFSINVTHEMTTKIDVTNAVEYCQNNNYRFYAYMIFNITKSFNSIKNYRYDLIEEELVCWDYLVPAFTIFDKEKEKFQCIWLDKLESMAEFQSAYKAEVDKYAGSDKMFPKVNQPLNTFDISAIPWVSFDNFSLNIANSSCYLKPIITIGKYSKQNGRLSIPISIKSHHATVDGFHVAKFFEKLTMYIE